MKTILTVPILEEGVEKLYTFFAKLPKPVTFFMAVHEAEDAYRLGRLSADRVLIGKHRIRFIVDLDVPKGLVHVRTE